MALSMIYTTQIRFCVTKVALDFAIYIEKWTTYNLSMN